MRHSAIIPAHNEAGTLAGVIEAVVKDVDEVIVVDSCSSDNTADIATKSGARVVSVSRPGKHYAVRAGIEAASGDHLVFIDGDIRSPNPNISSLLLEPLKPGVALVKGYYDRSAEKSIYKAGRLTEICARPLLAVHMPELARVREPLAGEFALSRSLARQLSLAAGFAVDLGILIACQSYGRIVEVEIGQKHHKHRSVHELGLAAVQVSATILGHKDGATYVPFLQYHGPQPVIHQVDIQSLSPIAHGKIR